jgi:hypothetical protein
MEMSCAKWTRIKLRLLTYAVLAELDVTAVAWLSDRVLVSDVD